jgi:hypothetical protein
VWGGERDAHGVHLISLPPPRVLWMDYCRCFVVVRGEGETERERKREWEREREWGKRERERARERGREGGGGRDRERERPGSQIHRRGDSKDCSECRSL